MCGILAYFGGAGNNLTRVITAMSAISYRAPDSTGVGFFGNDDEPVRARKAVGDLAGLIRELLNRPAYPNPTGELLMRLVAESASLTNRDIQQRLLAFEGFPPEHLEKLRSRRPVYPTYDDLVALDTTQPARLFPGFAGRPDPLPEYNIRTRKDLQQITQRLMVDYDLSTVVIQTLVRSALGETISRLASPGIPGLEKREILDAFDDLFERQAVEAFDSRPQRSKPTAFRQRPGILKQLWELLRGSTIRIPADFDRDGVRCMFRHLDAALLSRLARDPDPATDMEALLNKHWPTVGQHRMIDWRNLYRVEKTANVYGWAAAAAYIYLHQTEYQPQLDRLESEDRPADTASPGQTDPICLRYLSAPVIGHGRFALQAPVNLKNAHPFFDGFNRRMVVLNGQFEGGVETELCEFLQRVGQCSFRSDNSTEYLALLWGYYYRQLEEDQRRSRAIQSQVSSGLESFAIGSQSIDYQVFHRVKNKSGTDLDEMAFREAARQLARGGGQIAAVGISLESPRCLYLVSHNRPAFIVRRLENNDFMVVSDLNAAMGLFPQELIYLKTSALRRLEKRHLKLRSELEAARSGKNALRELDHRVSTEAAQILDAFQVEVYPLEGEELFARIETDLAGKTITRCVTISDLDGTPLPEIESFQTTLRPPALQRDLYGSYYEEHLHEIPSRMTDILNAYLTEDDDAVEFDLNNKLFQRRFGKGFATLKRVVLAGCGSSYNMALMAAAVYRSMMPFLQVVVINPAEVDDISLSIVPDNDLVILVSWSSTTADMVAFANRLAYLNAVTIAVTAKIFADMALVAKKSGGVVTVLSGEEVTVSGIKSTMCCRICLDLLAVWLAFQMNCADRGREILHRLQEIPQAISKVLEDKSFDELAREFAQQSAGSHAALVFDACERIGRAREVAWKLEETSWTAIGKPLEFRSANIDRLSRDPGEHFVLVNATERSHLSEAMELMAGLDNAEIRFVAVSITSREQSAVERCSGGQCVFLPEVEPLLQSYVDLAFYYQLAYHYGMAHGRNMADFPRNRVKSVTAGRSQPGTRVSPAAELLQIDRHNQSARSLAGPVFETSLWERQAVRETERQYYQDMRRLGERLQQNDNASDVFPHAAGAVDAFSRTLSGLLSGNAEIIFIPFDRPAEATMQRSAALWRRLLGCPLRVESPCCPMEAFTEDSLVVMAAAATEKRALRIDNLPEPGAPYLWIGSPLTAAEERLFARSLGSFIVSDGKGDIAADKLYAGLNHLLILAWKTIRPARAAILQKHFQQSGRVITSLLNNPSLMQSITDAMTLNAAYKSAFYIEPPVGNGAIWLSRFDQTREMLLERHIFGESAHGPLVTVDHHVDRKFVRLDDRNHMIGSVGADRLSAWEKKYLGGCSVDVFLKDPPPEVPYRIDAPFFAEGSWYLPELRKEYDTGLDNLIIVDATSERYFSQALDELATYSCRYARLIVISQEAFRKDPAKSSLYRYPISHLISIPAVPGPDGDVLPVSEYLLPFALNLIAAAMASIDVFPAQKYGN